MELVTIESLVPHDHLLRKIDATVEFGFMRERVRHLYRADNGRPALYPVMLFKLLLIGYLSVYGVTGSGYARCSAMPPIAGFSG
jgi:transposase